jgi:hypothetical protein
VPGLPAYQYLATISDSFRRYADARANRRDPFYVRRPAASTSATCPSRSGARSEAAKHIA